MRTIEQTGPFRRDDLREAKGPYRQTLTSDCMTMVTALTHGRPLADKPGDPALIGANRRDAAPFPVGAPALNGAHPSTGLHLTTGNSAHCVV
jgi:hypothetical protein